MSGGSLPNNPGPYDLVIRGGRIMDPESGRDEICDVAARDGRIVAIAPALGAGTREFAAAGLVVAPGFIDLHAHGQSMPADRMQAFDGVTTSLELELGSLPVAAWYEQQAADGRVINYGTSVAWVLARIAAMTGTEPEPSIGFMGRMMKDKRWIDDVASDSEVAAILRRVRTGLEQGGIGVGIPNAYAPESGVKEMSEICSLAAAFEVPTYTHIAFMSNVDPQSSIEAYTRLIGYAGSTGAHMHICHFNSTSLEDVERAAALVRTARRQGLKITVEAYPYGTGSTVLGAVFFSDPDFTRRTARRSARSSLSIPAAGSKAATTCSRRSSRTQARWCCGISSTSTRTSATVSCSTSRYCFRAARSLRTRCRGPSPTAPSTRATHGRCRKRPRRTRDHPGRSPASSAIGGASGRRLA